MNKVILRNKIYKTLSTIDSLLSLKNPITVFCYHSIGDDSFRFAINLQEFSKQIDYLSRNLIPLDHEALFNAICGKRELMEPAFMITFDDGYKNILAVRDLLRSKGIKPIVFVMPQDTIINYKELGQSFERLDTEDLKKLISDGWEIGSHSLSHSNFNKLAEKELRSEIIESKNKLEQELGIEINYFSYPKGNYNKTTDTLIKEAGYNAVFTMDDGVITKATDLYRIPRVGVDKTHNFTAFKQTFSPSNIKFRKFIKGLGTSGL